MMMMFTLCVVDDLVRRYCCGNAKLCWSLFLCWMWSSDCVIDRKV